MSQPESLQAGGMMSPESPTAKSSPSRTGPLGRWWRAGLTGLGHGGRRVFCALANGRRRLRRKKIPDYVVIALDHAVSERAPGVPWWYNYVPWIKLPLSLEYLETALERIAGDPDVRGVVFLVKGPTLSLAKAQSLARMLARFREWDALYCPPSQGQASQEQTSNANLNSRKEIIVHLEEGSAAALVLAAAADRAVMTPLSNWSFMGLRVAPLYLKETLDRVGLQFDVERVAPWKTAFENFQRSQMSPENRDQTNWLLDSLFDDIVHAIAQGRNLTPEAVRAHVDRAPLTADEACAAGLIDAALYEDELPKYLATPERTPQRQDEPARLARYAEIKGLLYRRARARHNRAVGVLTLEGIIVPGESKRYPISLPLVGDRFIGSRTAAFQVRAARRDRRLAAVVLHVDSGGGSALASDLIWRELKLLAQEKPLIVYLGDVAASGGYYIATPGCKIVAQSATLTGSIGVIIAKLVTGGTAGKLGAQREVIQRGVNADIYAGDTPWGETQRAKVKDGLGHIYAAFKARVSQGRNLPLEELDSIANGRVWTGKQALAHNLIDAVGDFGVALDLACAEAGLPQDGSVPTVNLPPPRTRTLAQPAKSTLLPGDEPGEALAQLAGAMLAGEWETILGRDLYWYWADGLPRIRE